MSAARQKDSRRSQVLDLAAAAGIVRRSEICEALGCSGDQADSAIAALLEQGTLVRIGRGLYQYASPPEKAPEAETEERVWRAMKINPTWTAGDVAMQAGTTLNYVRKLLRRFRADDLVRPAGRRPVDGGTGGSEKLWRVTMKGRGRAGRPVVETFEPDPLVVDAVTLNRLICTGVAQRLEAQASEALEICRRIMERLDKFCK